MWSCSNEGVVQCDLLHKKKNERISERKRERETGVDQVCMDAGDQHC